MILDTAQLRSLVAIAETGSFTRAAGHLNLTQSAISLQIKRLEEQVGRKLIDRDPRKLALTQDGELLLGYARRILALHKEAEGLLGQAEMTGQVRFGAPEYFDAADLSMLLAHFRRQHPNVQLEINIGLGPDMRREFQAGRLDVAVVNTELSGASGTLLGRDGRVWVAGLEFQRQPGEALPLVLFSPGCDWRRIATEALDRAGIAWTLALSSSGVTGLNAAIAAGLGVSVAPASGIGSGIREVGRELGLPELPPFEYRLVESRGAPPPARRLAQTIREVFGREDVDIRFEVG